MQRFFSFDVRLGIRASDDDDGCRLRQRRQQQTQRDNRLDKKGDGSRSISVESWLDLPGPLVRQILRWSSHQQFQLPLREGAARGPTVLSMVSGVPTVRFMPRVGLGRMRAK